MKSLTKNTVCPLLFLLIINCALATPTNSGFYLPEPIEQVTLRYTCVNNLIVLPVTINGNLKVNLILDTGTRNIVLFGKEFRNQFTFAPYKDIQFSGMGSGKPVYGKLSINNRVELTSLIGEDIPLVVVSSKNIFAGNSKIDGIIGYDIFQKFEVEIQPHEKLITFRSPFTGVIPAGYVSVPLQIEKTKPIIASNINLKDGTNLTTNLMIDTGSQLAVLLKSTDHPYVGNSSELIGKGLSGNIEGIKVKAQRVTMSGVDFYDLSVGITRSDWHNGASIGMGALKEYAMIINYLASYVCFKKL
jgi:hypothetical protein